MERWLTYEAAVALIGDWAGISKGAALPKLDEAIASETIRGRGTPEANRAFLIENEFVTGSTKPDELLQLQKTMENWEHLLNVSFDSSVRLGHVLISEDWQTSAVKKYVRYADDAALIAKGFKGVRDRKWPNANQAALELGEADTAKVDRLRRAIRKELSK